MTQCNNYKALPILTNDVDYEKWRKETKTWRMFTSLKKKKQTPAIFSTLTGQVCEAMWGHARELDLDTLAVDRGENFNHFVNDSDDTDIEDNLESDVLPNLETHSP